MAPNRLRGVVLYMFRKLLKNEQNDEYVVGKITLKAGEKVEFIVGVYENIIPQPNLELQFHPKRGRVSALLGRLDGRGDYTLVYNFTNFGRRECEITIRASWDDAIWDAILV